MTNINQFFAPEKLSQNLRETPEGYLLCCNVPIARAGDLLYKENETDVEAGESGLVILTRTIEELSKEDALSSFNGKPVVIGHPLDENGNPVFLNPDNWGQYAVGTTQNVRVGKGEDSDKIIADFLITDRAAIDAIISKEIREVSGGYSCTTMQISKGYGIQTNFVGNHNALVSSGRNGFECAIFDQEAKTSTRGVKMNLKQKFVKILGKTLDSMPELEAEASEERDIMLMLAKINLRLEKLEGMEKEEQERDYRVTDRRHRDKRMRDRRHRDEDEDIYSVLKDTFEIEEEEEKEEALQGMPIQDRRHRDEDLPEGEIHRRLDERLETIEEALISILKKIKGDTENEENYEDEDTEESLSVMMDSSVLSKAEILAPGIRASRDIKRKALKQAYKTPEGRKAINSVLDGKTFDSADTGLLFNAAAEVLRNQRRDLVNATKSFSNVSSGPKIMSPADINALNAKRWASN